MNIVFLIVASVKKTDIHEKLPEWHISNTSLRREAFVYTKIVILCFTLHKNRWRYSCYFP